MLTYTFVPHAVSHSTLVNLLDLWGGQYVIASQPSGVFGQSHVNVYVQFPEVLFTWKENFWLEAYSGGPEYIRPHILVVHRDFHTAMEYVMKDCPPPHGLPYQGAESIRDRQGTVLAFTLKRAKEIEFSDLSLNDEEDKENKPPCLFYDERQDLYYYDGVVGPPFCTCTPDGAPASCHSCVLSLRLLELQNRSLPRSVLEIHDALRQKADELHEVLGVERGLYRSSVEPSRHNLFLLMSQTARAVRNLVGEMSVLEDQLIQKWDVNLRGQMCRDTCPVPPGDKCVFCHPEYSDVCYLDLDK